MEYQSNSANQGYQKAQFAGIGSAIGAQTTAVPMMPTVASALGRIDYLNERLSQVSAQLAAIAVAVGGPYPTGANVGDRPAANGMVDRLNDSAENAHRQVGAHLALVSG